MLRSCTGILWMSKGINTHYAHPLHSVPSGSTRSPTTNKPIEGCSLSLLLDWPLSQLLRPQRWLSPESYSWWLSHFPSTYKTNSPSSPCFRNLSYPECRHWVLYGCLWKRTRYSIIFNVTGRLLIDIEYKVLGTQLELLLFCLEPILNSGFRSSHLPSTSHTLPTKKSV